MNNVSNERKKAANVMKIMKEMKPLRNISINVEKKSMK